MQWISVDSSELPPVKRNSPVHVVQSDVWLTIERVVSKVLIVEVRVHVQSFGAEMERSAVVGYDALAILPDLRLSQPLNRKDEG